MRVHRLTVATLTSLCALAGVLALYSGRAQAEVTHPYLCQITASSTPSASECNGVGNTVPGGSFGSPQGVAVSGTGQVYVSDGAKQVVDVFDPFGSFTRQLTGSSPGTPFTNPWGITIDGSNDVWVADVGRPGLMDKFDSAGGFLAQGTGAGHWQGTYTRSVAFSNASNHLYVADSNRDDLWVLNADGSYNSDIPGSEATWGEGCCFIYTAADNSGGATDGDVYVSSSNGSVTRINGAGSPAGFSGSASYISGAQLTGTPAGSFGELTGVSVDGAGHLYVLDNGKHVVDEFDAAGVFVGQTSGAGTARPSGSFSSLQGIAVSAAGKVYVADGGSPGVVDVFGPDAVFAQVSTGAAANVAKVTATLEGVVNPDETSVTGCVFEYRSEAEASYTHTASCAQALPFTGTQPVGVSANVSGLTGNTTYQYRLAATNANGTNYGSPQTFTTAAAVDALSTGPAIAITPSGAKLTGALSPDGSDAHYYFQYGTEASYGSVSPALPGTDAGSASASVPAETTLSGLAANTTYHYRLVGVNSFGTTYGEDATFTTPGPPAIGMGSSSGVGSTHARLNAQINPDGFATHYHFDYGTSISYGTSAPVPDGEIPLGSSEQTVSVNATGLQPNTLYHYRVVASSEGGTVNGADQTFTTLPPTLIESESASGVTATSATLKAQIDPLGSDTAVYFQYGSVNCTSSPASCTDVPLPPGIDIGSGEGAQSPGVHLQGLAPGSTYHYRVLATNTLGTAEGPDQTFTTQTAATVVTQPDGRAWELVTPPNKQGAGIIAIGNEQGADIQASVAGGAVTYGAVSPFVADPAGSNSPEVTQVFSRRQSPGSWESADISTPHNKGPTALAIGHSAEYKLFSDDLSLGLVEPNGDTPLPPLPAGAEKTIYLRLPDGGYQALVTSADVPPGTQFGGDGKGAGGVTFVGASSDLRHVVLSFNLKPTSSSVPSGETVLYEWSGGQLQLASVLPEGEPVSAVLGQNEHPVRQAVSRDGSRLIWSAYIPHGANSEAGHLYLRDMVTDETIAVDAAQGVPQPGIIFGYTTASSDDSRIFFTSSNRLTVGSQVSEGADLYEFELTNGSGEPLAGRLTDLSIAGNPGANAEVQGVIGASEDGSYVYFVAAGVLGDGGAHGAEAGGHNLYVAHHDRVTGAWSAPELIAALSGEDAPSWGSGGSGLKQMTSRVSPDGRYLAFMSDRSLTGYDNRDANSGVRDEEVFLYDANAGRVVCASCNPTGARPVGLLRGHAYEENLVDYAEIWDERWLAGNIPGWTTTDLGSALTQSRYLVDGGRLFFNSSDALVPGDVNGREDVYEYEPVGVGSCQAPGFGQSASVVFSAAVGGCVALISAGTSSEESAFMGASQTGGDVFFLTLSRLASRDDDTSIDLYDAHECTDAAPCAPQAALVPPPCTTGDACKAGPTPQPALFGAPSSETFSGAGNVGPSLASTPRASKSLTRAQKLASALRACARKSRGKRAACRRQARKRYAAKKAGKNSSAGIRR